MTLYSNISSTEWKMAENEIESARILLERSGKGDLTNMNYKVEEIQLPAIEGISAYSFCIPAMLYQWQDRIREIMIDSCCKSTSA